MNEQKYSIWVFFYHFHQHLRPHPNDVHRLFSRPTSKIRRPPGTAPLMDQYESRFLLNRRGMPSSGQRTERPSLVNIDGVALQSRSSLCFERLSCPSTFPQSISCSRFWPDDSLFNLFFCLFAGSLEPGSGNGKPPSTATSTTTPFATLTTPHHSREDHSFLTSFKFHQAPVTYSSDSQNRSSAALPWLRFWWSYFPFCIILLQASWRVSYPVDLIRVPFAWFLKFPFAFTAFLLLPLVPFMVLFCAGSFTPLHFYFDTYFVFLFALVICVVYLFLFHTSHHHILISNNNPFTLPHNKPVSSSLLSL